MKKYILITVYALFLLFSPHFFKNTSYAINGCDPSQGHPCYCWAHSGDGNPVWCGPFIPSSRGINPPDMPNGCVNDRDCCFARGGFTQSDINNNSICQSLAPTRKDQQSPVQTNNPATQTPTVCRCNGLKSTGIIKGQPTTYTAHEVCQGLPRTTKVVSDIKFFVAQNSVNGDETKVPIIAQSGPITPTASASDSARIDYVAQWTFTTPADLANDKEFRVFSTSDFTNILTMTSSKQTVLGTQTSSGIVVSFFDSINAFLLKLLMPFTLFTPVMPGVTPTPKPTPDSFTQDTQQFTKLQTAVSVTPAPAQSNSTNNNQIDTCQFVFKFPSS